MWLYLLLESNMEILSIVKDVYYILNFGDKTFELYIWQCIKVKNNLFRQSVSYCN